MKHKHTLTSTVAVAGAVVLAMSLTGCSNPLDNAIEKATDKVAEQGAEKLVEGMTGGGLDVEFESLPDGFPSDVPLISTDIVTGLKVKGDDGVIYSVTVSDARDVATVIPDVETDFAEWEETFSQEAAGISMYQYSKDSLQVGVNVAGGDYAAQDGGSIVQYTVSVASE